MKIQNETLITGSSVGPTGFKTDICNIPDDMKALPNWVAFRTETLDNGKIKKILLSPNKEAGCVKYLKWARSDDPASWSTFDHAADFVHRYKLQGLAFALSGSGMTCIDLDRHIDERGRPTELAQRFIDAAKDTYVEKSVSGRGLHIFYAGSRPSGYMNRNDKQGLEVYDSVRFISMTGDIYGGSSQKISPSGAELTQLLKSNLGKIPSYSAAGVSLGLSDSELIDRIRRSKVGGDFSALWNGEDICGNHSVSDMKLCNMFAFFSGGDAEQVERCFKSSGLYRPQKGDGYVRHTAQKACATLVKKYEPKRAIDRH